MAEFYFSSTLMWRARLDEIFRMAYENAFAGVEFWAQHFMSRGYSAEEYRKLNALYPLKTVLHNFSWDLNLASINDGMRKASILETKKAVDLLDSLGGYEITVHPGQRSLDMATDVFYERLKSSLDEIYRYAQERSIEVSLEIMEKNDREFIVSGEAIEKLTGDLPGRFYYTLDVAHCSGGEEEIFDTLERLKGISKIHISNRTGTKLHTPLSTGDYEFRRLLPRLEKYRLPMVIEGYDGSSEFQILKENINYLKEIGGL